MKFFQSLVRRLILGLATGFPLLTAAAQLSTPIYFDAAPTAQSRDGAVSLTPADTYDPARGYGWSTAPAESFSYPRFGGVRSPALVDGVVGPSFTLRLDLATGRWAVLAFLDDGWRNAHTTVIEADGRRIAHNPREFGLESEPSEPPLNRLRVAQFTLDAASDPVELRFSHEAPGARLLALQLVPLGWAESDLTRWFHRQFVEAGAHDSKAPLEALHVELGLHSRKPEVAAFATYWRAQIDLLAEAERWHKGAGWDWFSALTRSSMFVRYKIAVALLDPLVEHSDGDAFPLRDRAQWLRARLLYALWQEQHIEGDWTAFQTDIAELRHRHPQDKLVAMYAGEKVPASGAPLALTFQPGAPGWSTAQLEALARMRDIAHYWVDERQIPNGEFGGKTDDDVELLRWWSPLLLTGDAKAREGFRKLAEGVWNSPRMNLGYSREARDVEHSSEFVSDTVPLLALVSRDPVWIGRLGWSYRHMRDLWTGRNDHGDLHFKSAWIGATEILLEPPRNRDLGMNTRAAKAVRYHAWLTGDKEATQLLHDWSLSWAKAADGTDKGKPRGLFPASIRWPDATFNGDEAAWHTANMFWRYFEWSGQGDFYDQLLFSWLGTRNPQLLEPMDATLTLLEKHRDAASRRNQPAGSPGWAAGLLFEKSGFWNAVAQWRFETSDKRHDDLLKDFGPPYLVYRLTGNTAGLATGLKTTLLDVLRYNRPMLTSEVLFTDRVYVSHDEGNIDGADLLAAMLTGCHASDGVSPYFHVAWDQVPSSFTALVSSTGADHVTAEIFLHQTETGKVTARFFRVTPGEYRLTVATNGKFLTERIERVTGPDHRATFAVPGGKLATMNLTRMP